MPANLHTKKANTAKKKRQWDHVRESEMAKGESSGRADMIANGVVKRGGRKIRKGRAKSR